ncbi:putative spermidine/putrescine transport system substrate-binding protein [Bradyrhizobium sp. USDA 4503]
MRRTLCTAVIGLSLGALAPAKLAFAADQVTVVSAGGAYQTALRKAILEPFTKTTGIKITEDEFSDDIAKIRAMVESKSVSWDLVDTAGGNATQMCAEGIVETIDWKKLSLDRAKLLGGDNYDCGVPYVLYSGVIAYDKDKLPNGPKTMADFFDLNKFPGKRGLRKDPLGNLEWALIADGVPVKDVYKVLGTPEGVDRAFKKLDTIKKDVVWWAAISQSVPILADGQVVMTSTFNGRIYDANKKAGKHFEIMWDAQQQDLGIWVIPKGSAHVDAAYKFLAFAASPQPQANLTQYLPYGATNKDAMALVDPAILPDLPTAPDNMGNPLLRDSAFWAEKGDDLRQRFTAWLAK